MKKLLFGVSLVVALFARAEGDTYIYWMVGNSELPSGTAYDSVRFAAVDSSWGVSYLNLYDENFNALGTAQDPSVSSTQLTAANLWGAGFLASIAGIDPTAYSYCVELWNDGVAVAHTENKSWNDVKAYLVTQGNSMDPGSDSSWAPAGGGSGGFSPGAIPEPTSGIMVLLGMAALALRRRRRA